MRTHAQAGASSSAASQQVAASRREALALRAQLRKQQRFGIETTLASLERAHRSIRVRWLRSALPPSVLRAGESGLNVLIDVSAVCAAAAMLLAPAVALCSRGALAADEEEARLAPSAFAAARNAARAWHVGGAPPR